MNIYFTVFRTEMPSTINRMKTVIILVYLSTLILAGCATGTAGRPIDEAQVKQIEKGVTTEVDLLSAFGQPQSRGMDSEGRVMLMWLFVKTQVKSMVFTASIDQDTDTLQVILNPDGTVFSYNFGRSGTESTGSVFQ